MRRRCAGSRAITTVCRIVDAVTSLGGVPLEVDAWGADAVYSGTQKCLSCPPGISPVTMSARAVDAIRKRNAPVQSWFLDLNLVMAYWGGEGARVYHHTAPVNALYGLHEALVMLEEEGLENSWKRHAREHAALRAGVEAMGLRFFVDERSRLPQLNSIVVPDGVVEADVRRALLHEFDLEIGAGLGALGGQGMARRPHGTERVPAQRVVLPERDGSDPRPQRSRCGGARGGIAERPFALAGSSATTLHGTLHGRSDARFQRLLAIPGLPPPVARSFRCEQLTECTLPVALSLIEGGFAAVVAAKTFDVDAVAARGDLGLADVRQPVELRLESHRQRALEGADGRHAAGARARVRVRRGAEPAFERSARRCSSAASSSVGC